MKKQLRAMDHLSLIHPQSQRLGLKYPHFGIGGSQNSTDLRLSPTKHRFQKIQNQIFTNPLLALFVNPFANDVNILSDSDQVSPNPVQPSREVYQDETSKFETYIHPDFIRALPGRVWLPVNPRTRRFNLDEGVIEREECLTSSLFPKNESSIICYQGNLGVVSQKSENTETAIDTTHTGVAYDRTNQHLVYVADPNTPESETGSTFRRRGTVRGTGSSIIELIGGAFRGLGSFEHEPTSPHLSIRDPNQDTRRSSVSSGLST
ncbi:hypothetical protein K7432_007342 [Basidiobolus ranarum]|uniref:Uncharacterized protein n=1 Tax=Basidiobolus ranarum TaxID=34480 RepID=A0ABR2WTL7_9FUNG